MFLNLVSYTWLIMLLLYTLRPTQTYLANQVFSYTHKHTNMHIELLLTRPCHTALGLLWYNIAFISSYLNNYPSSCSTGTHTFNHKHQYQYPITAANLFINFSSDIPSVGTNNNHYSIYLTQASWHNSKWRYLL